MPTAAVVVAFLAQVALVQCWLGEYDIEKIYIIKFHYLMIFKHLACLTHGTQRPQHKKTVGAFRPLECGLIRFSDDPLRAFGFDHGAGHPSCLCVGQSTSALEERSFRGLKFYPTVADTVIDAELAASFRQSACKLYGGKTYASSLPGWRIQQSL
jgi:hypothetical protein